MPTHTPEKRLQDVADGLVQSTMVSFRVNAADAHVLLKLTGGGVGVSEILRRGLRRIEQETWEQQLREQAATMGDEDLNAEPDAW